MISFDIETAPQSDEYLRKCLPPLDESVFEVGEFDASSVKLGAMKKQDLIDEKIQKAREAHDRQKEMQASNIQAAHVKHFEDFRDAATLNAAYGRVLAIGLFSPEKDVFVCDPCPDISYGRTEECDILRRFWLQCVVCIHGSRPIVGLNIFQFDLPFMLRRSWILGVEVANIIVRDVQTRWPKWHERFVDLRQLWLLGTGWDTKSNFTTLSHAFGTYGKTEGSGKFFWKLWSEDRDRAVVYLEQDVRQPAEWAQRMGVR